MRLRTVVSVAAACILMQAVCFGQNAAAEAEAYVASIKAFAEKEGEPHVIFADVSDYNEESKAVWKKYDSLKDFENSREEEESYTVAFVWKKEGRIAAVNFTYSSPSGDWAHYVEYVFRPDGSAAGIRRELRTFLGDLIVIRTSLLDEKGVELKSSKEFLDLESEKPVKPTDSFQDIEVPLYKKVADLPFAIEVKGENDKQ